MSATFSFTPDVLDSYSRFCDFFKGSQAIATISKEAENPSSSKPVNLASRWQVAYLKIAAPFSYIYAVFARAISKLLFAIGAKAFAIQLAVHCKIWERDARLETLQLFGEHCMIYSTNARAQNASDVYLQEDLPVNAIKSKGVQELIDPKFKKLSFFNEIGCCRGMSEWFLYLYFRTRHLFKDPEAHMLALGRLFEHGAPREAILLQALCHSYRDFLGMAREGKRRVVNAVPSDERNCQKIENVFRKMKPGAYAIGTSMHRLNYFCTGDGQGYVFDPSHGIIAIKNHEDIARLAKRIMQYRRLDFSVLLKVEKIVAFNSK